MATAEDIKAYRTYFVRPVCMMHADRTSIMYEGSAWDIPNAPVHTTRPEHLTCQRPQCAHITFEPKGCRCRKELQAPRRPTRESTDQRLQEPVPTLAVRGTE